MKHQPAQVRARFAECFVGDVVISAITLAELEFGVACSGEGSAQNEALLASLLEDILVAPFEGVAARAYGPLRAANRERNKDALDKLIAAHAISLGAILVTNNEADFCSYDGLVVENWVKNH
jgi:tRNA(fMet)-specific endonuclease VapC